MDKPLYKTFKNAADKLSALKHTHTLIGNMILSVYGNIISTKKELARYIYNAITVNLDDICIDETTRSYFRYFEDIYKDFPPFSPNALGTSQEYAHFKDFPEIYSIYNKFASNLCSCRFAYKEVQSPNIEYHVPLWYVPILSAFIRVLYSKKKLDKISAGQFLESISKETYKVIFENFPFVYGTDSTLGNPDILKLLYRYCLGILYEINAAYATPDDPVMPCISYGSEAYYNCMVQFRTTNHLSFFTHIMELYWKNTWKPLMEERTYHAVKTHYICETKTLSLVLIDTKVDSFIISKLSEKNSARFKIVADAFGKIDSNLEKYATTNDRNKCFSTINKIIENYLQEIEKDNQNIISPLVEQVCNKLEQLALSRKDIIICYADKETMKSDYANAFHNIFGIYDMAALTIKYLLRNQSLTDENKYKLLKEQILPQLPPRDKKEYYNRLKREYDYFYHTSTMNNIAPADYAADFQEIQQLFQLFSCGQNMAEEDLCGQFDELVKNILSISSDKDNCFSYIFQALPEAL